MNIETVRDNLRNTIAGKVELLKEMLQRQYDLPHIEARALSVTMEFVEINIAELKRILADVEVCMNTADANSWIDNPDRSGGQFTQDEIDNAGRWQ